MNKTTRFFGFVMLISAVFVPASAFCQVYADQCPGADIGAKIMACQASLPTATAGFQYGYKVGTIILPNTSVETNLTTWSSPVVLGPGVSLTGQGVFASNFNCTVKAGNCLTHDESYCTSADGLKWGCVPLQGSTPANHHTVVPNAVYQGFAITGSSTSAPQNIFVFLDATGVTVRDVVADGAYLSGGACFLFEDVNFWTERNLFENASTLYNCNIGWRFATTGNLRNNPLNPQPSFGYNRFLDIKFNTAGAQTAFSFENGSFIYKSTFRVTGNKGGAGSTIIHMQDAAELYYDELHFYGEENGSGGDLLDLRSGSNQISYFGEIAWDFGYGVNNPNGALVVHKMDSWDYFNYAQNNFGNGLSLGNARWTQGTTPPGTCGNATPDGNGSLYSDIDGSTGSTLYTCVNSLWVPIK